MEENSGASIAVLVMLGALGVVCVSGPANAVLGGGAVNVGTVEAVVELFRGVDPALAWGSDSVGRPARYFGVLAAMLVAYFGVVFAVAQWSLSYRRAGYAKRSPLGTSPEARLGSKRDLRPLWVSRAVPDRFLVGRVGRQYLATENRLSESSRAHGRATDRGAAAFIGPSRSGKTTAVISALSSWKGPMIAVSTKDDVLSPTLAQRRELGEVGVFDPTGLLTEMYSAGAPPVGWDKSLFRAWSPLRGIDSYEAASARAYKLCPPGASADVQGGEFFVDSARNILTPLLFAAAISGNTFKDVLTWVVNRDGFGGDGGEVLRALTPRAGDSWQRTDDLARARDLLRAAADGDATSTRDSIVATLMTQLGPWMAPAVARSTVPIEDRDDVSMLSNVWKVGPGIDLDWLLAEGSANSLYITARPDDLERLSKIYTGCLADLASQVLSRAAAKPISPPLLIVFDEAGNMPIPDLPRWASLLAGYGVQLVTVWQDKAQIERAYGRSEGTVMANHLTKLFFPGISDQATLDYVAKLVGAEEVQTRSQSYRSVSTAATRVELAPANVLRQMEPGSGLLLHGTLPPAVVQTLRGRNGLFERLGAFVRAQDFGSRLSLLLGGKEHDV